MHFLWPFSLPNIAPLFEPTQLRRLIPSQPRILSLHERQIPLLISRVNMTKSNASKLKEYCGSLNLLG